MHHHEHHNSKNYNIYFMIGSFMNIIYSIVEVSYGFYTNSISLITDAFHNLSDVLSLLIAWTGYYLSSRKPTNKRTYGFRKASILASLTNSIFLLVSIGAILLESIRKLSNIEPIQVEVVWKVALVGIFVNFGTAYLFYQNQEKKQYQDLNIKSAFLHMFADGMITLGVIISAFIIKYTAYFWIDSLFSIAVSFFIIISTSKVLYHSLNLILDAVPENINIFEIQNFFKSIPEIKEIHNLHIWALSTVETALTVHLVKTKHINENRLLTYICEELKSRFNIHYVTIQFENEKILDNCIHAHCEDISSV